MSKHYAIELVLMLYQGGQWVRTMTYYNHGEEPPYGGVKSNLTSGPLVLSVQGFEDNVKAVESWRRNVVSVCKTISPILNTGLPDGATEYKITPSGSDLTYDIVMDSLDMEVAYDHSARTVTFAARTAYDVAWRGFLFHQETMLDFLESVKALQ